jgi:HEAT repeat protein
MRGEQNMPLFGSPNIEELTARGNVKGLIKALSYQKDVIVRQDAVRALVEMGYGSEAAAALGKAKDAQAKALLLGILESNDHRARQAAVQALDKLDWQPAKDEISAVYWITKRRWDRCTEIGAAAVEPLIVAFKDQDSREDAARALVKIGNIALKALTAALNDEQVRSGVMSVSSKLGWQLDKGEVGAIYCIAQRQWKQCVEIGAPAVEPLVAVFRGGNEHARVDAADALGQIAVRLGDSALRDQIVKLLIAALTDVDQNVRRTAAKALGSIGDVRAVEPLTVTLKQGRQDLRQTAAEALGQIGDGRAMEALITVFRGGDTRMRIGVTDVLAQVAARVGDSSLRDQTVSLLIAALTDVDQNVRRTAAKALGSIGDVRAVEPLTVALEQRQKDLRQTAAEALGRIGDKRAVGALIAALNTDIGLVAAEALDSIGWQPDKSEAAAAYWIAKDQWDRCVEVGLAAVEPLIAALKNTDARVQRSAARVLGEIGDTRAVEPLVPLLYNGSTRGEAAEALDKLGCPSWSAQRKTEQDWLAGHVGKCADCGRFVRVEEAKVERWPWEPGYNLLVYFCPYCYREDSLGRQERPGKLIGPDDKQIERGEENDANFL